MLALLSRDRVPLRFSRLSNLRYRLLILVLVPLLLLSGTVILLASFWYRDFTYQQLFAKVNTDLRVAGNSFQRIKEDGQRDLSSLARDAAFSVSLSDGNTEELLRLLEAQRLKSGFDFLNLWSSDGSQSLQSSGWRDKQFRHSPLTQRMYPVTDSRAGFAGVEIYEFDEWSQQDGINASTVLLPLIATARAAPSVRQQENRAMVIRMLQPVFNAEQEPIALLESGFLLNRNFEFVDHIRDLVYGPGSLVPGSLGTVTVFLEDVRITTNVPSYDETRALGTRVSVEVRDAVLREGKSWVDRAFVVNDWYISAYEPIVDVGGKRVGMLYAGYLEAPFRDELIRGIAVLSTLVLAGSLLAAGAAILGARAIFTPVETMTSVVRATAAGERKRIGPILTGTEIGELAFQFDAMLDNLESHRARIERDAALLEEKVQFRTAELERQNQRLQDSIDLLHRTRQQLAMAEKLAALGELTAGVAHEINNPTAVILGNMDVLVADLGTEREKVQTEIDLIIEQVYRIRSITDRLLQYSRRELQSKAEADNGTIRESDRSPVGADSDGYAPLPVSLEPLVDDTLKLLRHEMDGRQIVVTQRHEATLLANIDRQELQQVLVNLISNAIEAIVHEKPPLTELDTETDDNGVVPVVTAGKILVETCNHGDRTVLIRIRDTGCGIAKQHLPKVFDPFFTSGKVMGTGLGLSVSYGIVRRFGGDIQVVSELGQGSQFDVLLPAVNTCVAGTAK